MHLGAQTDRSCEQESMWRLSKMINRPTIFMTIAILQLAFVNFTMETYKTDAAIWSPTETTNRKDDSSAVDSDQITSTNIPESSTSLASMLHNELNVSLENLLSGFNISSFDGNCTDHGNCTDLDADELQYISYDGGFLHELVRTAWELRAQFNTIINTAMLFSCTENTTIGHRVISMSRTYVNKCTEFVVRLNDSTAAMGEVGVLDTVADVYTTSMRHVGSVMELVERLTEMISEVAKIDAMYQSIKQQYEEMYFFNDTSVWEIIVGEQNKLVNLVKNCFERAENMSEHRQENPFVKAITSSNISRFLDTLYWANLIEDETQTLQTYKTYVFASQHDDFLLYKLTPVITAIFLVVGMTGNGLLLTIFIRHKETRTLTNAMLINLTVVDCVSLVINMLLDYLRVIMPWQFGLLGCQIFFFFCYLFLGVSTYSVVMISFQRFVAVRGLSSLVWCHQGKKTTYVLIASVWGLGLVLSVLHAVIADVDRAFCSERSYSKFGLVSTVDLIVFCVVPLIIVAVCSGLTAYRIRRSIGRIPGEATGQAQLKHDRMVSSNVLVALVVLFVVSYMPDFLLTFLVYQVRIDVPDWKFNLASVITYCLRYVNCCLNPIVLFAMTKRYRGYIKRYCGQEDPANK